MKTAYTWLSAAILIMAACSEDESGGKEKEVQAEEYTIRIPFMTQPSGITQRSAEELPIGLSVTYEKADLEKEASTRGTGLTIDEESAVDKLDIFTFAYKKGTQNAITRIFHKSIGMNDMEGPFLDELWGELYYYYKTYFIPDEIPPGYEDTSEKFVTANFNELVFETCRDMEEYKYSKNVNFASEADITPNGKLLFQTQLYGYDSAIELNRINAKIDVTVNINNEDMPGSDLGDLKLTSIQLKNAPKTYCPKYSQNRNPVYIREDWPDDYHDITKEEKDNFYMDYEPITGDDIGRSGRGDRFVWYVLPNFNYFDYPYPNNASEKDKTIENAPSSYYPLHIELSGTYKNKEITFRICPGYGYDPINDYSILSNTLYKINVNISYKVPRDDNRVECEWPD